MEAGRQFVLPTAVSIQWRDKRVRIPLESLRDRPLRSRGRLQGRQGLDRSLRRRYFEAHLATVGAEDWARLRRLSQAAAGDNEFGHREAPRRASGIATHSREDLEQTYLAKTGCRQPRQSGSKQCRRASRSAAMLAQHPSGKWAPRDVRLACRTTTGAGSSPRRGRTVGR